MTRRLGTFVTMALASAGFMASWYSGSALADDVNPVTTSAADSTTTTTVASAGDATTVTTQNSQRSEATATDMGTGNLSEESVGFKPMAGVMDFSGAGDSNLGDARFATGLGIEFNLAKAVTEDPAIYTGLSTGFIYSRLGGNNWVGRGEGNSPSTDTVLMPADLKIGYNITDNLRLSAHGGGNVAYFSNAGIRGDSGFTAYPNAGADLEVGFGNHLSVLVRPDWTFTGGNTLFTGMAGLGLLIG